MELTSPIFFFFALVVLNGECFWSLCSQYLPFLIDDIVLFCGCSDDIVARDIHVKEWKLVYAPQNPILEELLFNAAKSLRLDSIVGANSSEELEAIMFNRELVAGVQFNHPAVSILIWNF